MNSKFDTRGRVQVATKLVTIIGCVVNFIRSAVVFLFKMELRTSTIIVGPVDGIIMDVHVMTPTHNSSSSCYGRINYETIDINLISGSVLTLH